MAKRNSPDLRASVNGEPPPKKKFRLFGKRETKDTADIINEGDALLEAAEKKLETAQRAEMIEEANTKLVNFASVVETNIKHLDAQLAALSAEFKKKEGAAGSTSELNETIKQFKEERSKLRQQRREVSSVSLDIPEDMWNEVKRKNGYALLSRAAISMAGSDKEKKGYKIVATTSRSEPLRILSIDLELNSPEGKYSLGERLGNRVGMGTARYEERTEAQKEGEENASRYEVINGVSPEDRAAILKAVETMTYEDFLAVAEKQGQVKDESIVFLEGVVKDQKTREKFWKYFSDVKSKETFIGKVWGLRAMMEEDAKETDAEPPAGEPIEFDKKALEEKLAKGMSKPYRPDPDAGRGVTYH